jgi:energy-coupling factor transporter ATP-binding protein EcfA2
LLAFVKAVAILPNIGVVVAITGKQGVGKSMLANALAGITRKGVGLSVGKLRCEKVPMLLRTCSRGEAASASWLPREFEGEAASNLLPISHEEARRIANEGIAPNGGSPVLVDYPLDAQDAPWLPQGVYLLVLPGFEKNTEWAELGTASMLLSDEAIYVADEQALASESGKSLLREYLARVGGDSLKLVVSKRDQSGASPEELLPRISELGDFCPELDNLFFTAIPSQSDKREWKGVTTLLDALGKGRTSARDRQLAFALRELADVELEMLWSTINSWLEKSEITTLPNSRTYIEITDRVISAKEKALKAGRQEIHQQVERRMGILGQTVREEVYDKASGFRAFHEAFNPFRAYKDTQPAELDALLSQLGESSLKGFAADMLIVALKSFATSLPGSNLGNVDDKVWADDIHNLAGTNFVDGSRKVCDEYLAALKPVAELMQSILEEAASKRSPLSPEILKKIAKEKINTVGIGELRRGLFALGLLESADLGVELAGGSAASAGAAGSAAAAGISTGLAWAAGGIGAAVIVLLCLRLSTKFKDDTSSLAQYTIQNQKGKVEQDAMAGVERLLDWFQSGLDKRFRLDLGIDDNLIWKYRLAAENHQIRKIRVQTLRELDRWHPSM